MAEGRWRRRKRILTEFSRLNAGFSNFKLGGEMCERVAILIVHGIGEEQPYGALDQFTRGLLNELDPKKEWVIQPAMSQEPDPTRPGSTYSRVVCRIAPPLPIDFESEMMWSKRLEKAGTQEPDSPEAKYSEITLFEYYWSPITKNKIKYTTSLLFLIKAGLQPFKYLASNTAAISTPRRWTVSDFPS